MMTKRQLIEQAYTEMGLRPGVFSLTPEMMETALQRLDSMMATWSTANGIRVGYALPSSIATSDPDQDSGLPDVANEPVYTNLSLRLAVTIGKTPAQSTMDAARDGKNMLISWVASSQIPEMQRTRQTPIGSGNKPYRGVGREFFQPVDALDAGADSFLDSGDGSALPA